MPWTDVELCSAALVKIGAQPIAGFDDTTTEADVASRLYPFVRDALMSAHPWGFTLAQKELVSDPTPPLGDFDNAFLLPDDLLRTVSAGEGGSGRGLVYRVQGARLQTSAEQVLLTYQRRAPESEFPAHFVQALIARLAAELCIPLTESTTRSEVLIKLASAELQLAKLLDSQQATPPVVDDFSLVSARFE